MQAHDPEESTTAIAAGTATAAAEPKRRRLNSNEPASPAIVSAALPLIGAEVQAVANESESDLHQVGDSPTDQMKIINMLERVASGYRKDPIALAQYQQGVFGNDVQKVSGKR